MGRYPINFPRPYGRGFNLFKPESGLPWIFFTLFFNIFPYHWLHWFQRYWQNILLTIPLLFPNILSWETGIFASVSVLYSVSSVLLLFRHSLLAEWIPRGEDDPYHGSLSWIVSMDNAPSLPPTSAWDRQKFPHWIHSFCILSLSRCDSHSDTHNVINESVLAPHHYIPTKKDSGITPSLDLTIGDLSMVG